eukprot:CAMPEP_0194215316 /NCGR_PEP_ID=MMETSP0156-20130528/17036_1 /TAXON_ID=33649 /ORGANISM="Thalassionema nitzschioides, Strain L26-B" /LENGTH=430 /DNA_ID=CAMNT_0038943799 /DNA_START=155 /DNA_END=1443 /DNA_ORIENTATION=-
MAQQDVVFLLDIRNDSRGCISESIVHRRIIDMYKSRDDFSKIDLNIQTSKPLTAHARVDIANALQHMKTKHKHLRRLRADLDYIDASIHEFVLLNCLLFQEIQLTSLDEETEGLSVGIAMALRHALTCNGAQCLTWLELSCDLNEETCSILQDGFHDSQSLRVFHYSGRGSRSSLAADLLERLTGKTTLVEMQITDTDAEISESLAALFGDSRCRIQEFHLGYDWTCNPPFDAMRLAGAFSGCSNACHSLTKLYLDGIPFPDDSLQFLPLVFPNLETLSIASYEMPQRLAFLDVTPSLNKLKYCYFPSCARLNFEEGRRLVDLLPNVVDLAPLELRNDPVVQHFMDWTKCGRGQQLCCGSLWPRIIERTNVLLAEDKNRRANTVYKLLQDYYQLQLDGLMIVREEKEEEEEEEEGGDNFQFPGSIEEEEG